ncbi:phosphate ABC transporter substrate-binding protein [Shewanella sp. VB17]|uniref:phosphate ABC transporter substrate-binding protein n=1 Tax=Shewanella sp. VB17 TaxID=2739432 RepID=UPI0020B8223B|nr:phosphate ABC transporter substrate-binding protein [Shewanella sp. VB17]
MLNLFKYIKMLVILSLSLASLLTVNLAVAEVAVIVHPSNASDFDASTIKKIFLGKQKSFSNGKTAIVLSVNNSDPVMTEFNQKVMDKSNSQIKAYWSKIIFTGKGTPPQEMASAGEVISSISSNPDSIGYIDASLATDAVKVVAKF